MKAFANVILIAIALAGVAVIFNADSLWYFVAWLVGLTVGAMIFTVLIALHRQLKKRCVPYWWMWHSLTFPVDYWRATRNARIAGDSDLMDAANLLFSAPETWFTMRMIRVIGKEMNKRHEELKGFEGKSL